MASMSLPSIELKITADGSAAIEELEKTSDAIKKVETDGAGSGAASGMDKLGDAAKKAGAEAQNAAKGVNALGKNAETSAKQASVSIRELGEQMSKVGKSMSLAVTTPIVAALTASVKGASDMTETLGKTDVVFGQMSESVQEWASTSVDSMGLAQQTALDMASTYGDMATGMGLSQEAAAKMATSLTQLGADLASFKNIGIDEVNTAMTAVFTGETESLKRLGIVMTQTNLQQYAYSQGIQKNIADMTQAEQVQLRYQYVMASTANAQGDFQRTGGNLANQTRALGQSIKELGNSFGALLIPAVTTVVSAIRDGVNWITQMDDSTKRIILAVGMAVAAIGPLLLVGGKLLTLIAGIKTALAALTINPVILGIAAAVAGVTALVAAMSALQPKVDTASDSYQQLRSDIIKGAAGKVTLDTTGVPDNVEVTITANGQAALDKAKEIVEQLDTDPQFDGKLAIDGNPQKAKDKIAEIKADIEAVEAAVSINGNPKKARDAMDELERDINDLEGAVVITEDPETKRALQIALNRLRTQLANLKANVVFNDDGSAVDAYREKLEKLPLNQTYTNTGEFTTTGMDATQIEAYATALAHAASATGEYGNAVDALNKIVDDDAQRQQQEVADDLAATYRDLAAQRNDGLITEEQYVQKIGEANEAATEKNKNIEKEAELRKSLNEQLANGSRLDDAEASAEIAKQLYKDEHVTAEQGEDAAARIAQGKSMDAQLDAETKLQSLMNQREQKQQAINDAVEQYQQTMAQVNEKEQTGATVFDEGSNTVVKAQEGIERANILKDALENYRAYTDAGFGADEAISNVIDGFGEKLQAYEGLEEQLRGLMEGNDGNGANTAEIDQSQAELDTFVQECQTAIDENTTKVAGMKQTALETLGETTTEALKDFSPEDIEATLGFLDGYGVEVDEKMRGELEGTVNLGQAIADACNTGDNSAVQSVIDSMFSGVDFTSATAQTGADTVQGMANAISDNAGLATGAAESVGNSTVDAFNSSTGCHSPSTKTAETGRNLVAGLVQGMSDTGAVTAAATALGQAAVSAIQQALASVDGSESESIGAALLGGIADGAHSGSGGIASALRSAVASAASAAASSASSSGRSIGVNLMSGIHSGISSMVSSIAQAAANAVRQAVAAAKAAGEIHSPSRVMEREVGTQLMRGMEVGVENRAPTTLERIRDSVSNVLSGAATVIAKNGIPAPTVVTAPAAPGIDYERLGDVIAARPVTMNMNGKRVAQLTRDDAARQQAIRVAQINAGYGGR